MSATLLYFLGLAAAVAAIIGLALFFFCQCRATPEEGLALSALSIMAGVYAFGLAGNAKIAFYLLLMLSVLGWALALFCRRIGRKGLISGGDERVLKAFFSPAVLLFLAAALVSAVAFMGACYQNWDEFVQWGKAVRYMGKTNLLPVGPAYDGQGYMQSATTYFHYFTGMFTRFDEAAAYVSNAMLCFAGISLCFSGCEKKDAPRVFLFGLMSVLAMNALYELPLYNIYTDQAVALWTGALLCYRIRANGERGTRLSWVLTALALLCVAMLKPQTGLLFAFLAMIAIVAMQLGSVKKSVSGLSGKQRVILLAAALLVVLCPIVIKRVWEGMTTGGLWFNTGRFQTVIRDRALLWRLFYTLYEGAFKPIANVARLSYFTGFVFAAALLHLGANVLPAGAVKKRYVRTGALYLTGFFAYFAIVYLTYLVLLPWADMENATSLNRYLGIYLLAGFLPLTAVFFTRERNAEPAPHAKLIQNAACLALTVLLGASLSSGALYDATALLRWDDPYYRMYMDVRANAERVVELTDGEPIYYIYQANDSAAAAAEYAYGKQWDRTTGAYRFSADNVATTGLNSYDVAELPEKLLSSGVRYLYVDETDEYFTNVFLTLFHADALNSGDLFAVAEADGKAALTFIENVHASAPDPRAVERAH